MRERRNGSRLRVLYTNHTSQVSGAEHSLLTLLSAMDPEHIAGLACPDGQLADEAATLGVTVFPTATASGSLRLHPQHTPVAIGQLLKMGLDIRRAVAKSSATIMHANSVRAGLGAIVARGLNQRALVIHIRDCLPDGHATRLVRSTLVRNSDALIAVSGYVGQSFSANLGCHETLERIHVIDNPVDLARFRPLAEAAKAAATTSPVVAIIGQITPWKGHDVVINAFPRVRASLPDARLLIVGEVKFSDPGSRFDNAAFMRTLHRLTHELGLIESIDFVGERNDIPEIMRSVDAIVVPSTEEPFGRTVAEAMATGTPVIATSNGGPAEMIKDGISGTLVEPGDPCAWAEAIVRVLTDRERSRQMAAHASAEAIRRFQPSMHAASVKRVYARVEQACGDHANTASQRSA